MLPRALVTAHAWRVARLPRYASAGALPVHAAACCTYLTATCAAPRAAAWPHGGPRPPCAAAARASCAIADAWRAAAHRRALAAQYSSAAATAAGAAAPQQRGDLPSRVAQHTSGGGTSSSPSSGGTGGGSPAAAAAFVSQLRACAGDERALARAAAAVARRPRGAQRQLVADLAALLEQQSSGGAGDGTAAGEAGLSGPLLCQVLWAASRADACPQEAMRRLFDEAVPAAYASLSALAPADLARLVSAYAAAACYSQELFAAATEFVWEKLLRMTPDQITQIAAAYAAVGHYDDDEDLWDGIASTAVARLHDFEPEQLASLLESAALLRFRHAALCSAALGAAAAGTARWPTGALAQVVWALGWLGHGLGPGEGPQLDRVAAAITTRLRNLMTSTDASRVVPMASSRVPGTDAGVVSGRGAAAAAISVVTSGGDGGAGFLGTSAETAALAARSYSWQEPWRAPRGAAEAEAAPRPPAERPRRPHVRLVASPLLRGERPAAQAPAAGPGDSFSAVPQPPPPQTTNNSGGGGDSSVRPALEPPGALREALCRLAWGYTSLGRLPGALLRESFKLLDGYPATEFTRPQLAMLFEAAARAQAAALGTADAHPLMATSARVFMAELKRAPRPVALGPELQPLAFAAWMRGTRGGRAPLAPPPPIGWRHGRPPPGEAWPGAEDPPFSSWRFRDPCATTRDGMEASLSAALAAANLVAAPLAPALTLDGVLEVPLPVPRGNARVAVEPLPPAAAARNPPHTPLGAAAMRHALLRHRGWGVAQVLFSDWAEAVEGGERATAEYLGAAVADAESEALCSER